MKDVTIRFSGLLATLLTVLFVGLKLANIITWSWWWVFCPLWIDVAILIVILLIMILFYFIFKNH
jgi:hypothetical protein